MTVVLPQMGACWRNTKDLPKQRRQEGDGGTSRAIHIEKLLSKSSKKGRESPYTYKKETWGLRQRTRFIKRGSFERKVSFAKGEYEGTQSSKGS